MAASTTIVAKGLTKRYGDLTAVDHLDLEVDTGEVFGLLGPNGAGKTTTILMLLGLSEPSEGTVQVAGLDPTRKPLDVKRIVGYLPDNVGFYDSLTGRQNLRYTARLNSLPKEASERRIAALLTEVGLAEAGDAPAGTYSRGMLQRLGLADALVKDPQILILDEPTMAIDPEGVAEILRLIRFLAEERGVTLLLSSHLLNQVQAVCDRVGIFVQGKLIAKGRPDQLVARNGLVTVELGVSGDGDMDKVEKALQDVPGVSRVERPNGRSDRLWHLTTEADTVPAIVQAAIAGDLSVWHVRRLGTDLADIYHHYFKQEASQ
ncbi:MAG: ABC transporter ATP-binding protein [Acidimicrobiia bacterium]|nr:ABC transporter ATP-binding protein [Acidimicrobiia bacterium]MDH5616149.1 ABC transporter ATP-binding protein [Acidimicrobiia bacterium]